MTKEHEHATHHDGHEPSCQHHETRHAASGAELREPRSVDPEVRPPRISASAVDPPEEVMIMKNGSAGSLSPTGGPRFANRPSRSSRSAGDP